MIKSCALILIIVLSSNECLVGKGIEPIEMVNGRIQIPAADLAIHTKDGAKIGAVNSSDTNSLSVKLLNGLGCVYIDAPLVSVKPGTNYKITAEFRVRNLKLGSFACLVVEEYDNFSDTPKIKSFKTHSEFSSITGVRESDPNSHMV